MSAAERKRATREDLAAAASSDMPIRIVPYDPAWPRSYEAERKRIGPLMAGAVLHHIGSTAVPGLAAKPIIDIAVLLDSFQPAINRLVRHAGYQYPPAFNATLSRQRFLCYPTPTRRTHHLHLTDDPAQLESYLRFRDRLRASPELARRYEALKRTLAAQHPTDRDA